jgi:protein gp37
VDIGSTNPRKNENTNPAQGQNEAYNHSNNLLRRIQMNRTRIEWCDYTLNPIVGCPHNCPFCYARRQAKRQKQRCQLCYQFTPHPHLERLDQLLSIRNPSRIFIDSMWDWNAEGVKEKWLTIIIERMRECPQHTFQILSKRPERYARFEYSPNVWLGTSVSTTSDCFRVRELSDLKAENIKFVSVEPIHEEIGFRFSSPIDWIIVGAETGQRKGKVKAESEWIDSIIENARTARIPLFIKDNVHWKEEIREFPRT